MKRRSQLTLAGTGFEKYTKVTRRAQFLAEMERVVPWRELCARIAPVYPRAENGRPPIGLERMLRMYFLQHWFNLSDPAVEEALYDSPTMRAFVGIDLGREPVPDETTVCKFRHLLEDHRLGQVVFEIVAQHLRAQGVTVSTGTIVDATIISAPSSTKNATGTRDPEMHQTRKGQQWYFGMKGHFGIDSQNKLIHSVVTSPANVHDSQALPWLLHGRERRVWGDSAYAGQRAVLDACAPHARDFTHRKGGRARALSDAERATNHWKSRVRARVEHPIGVIKRVFGFTKVCYRGLAKNTHRLVVACALANLFIARRRVLRWQEP
jgi:transposase, IS5 family